MKKLLILDSNSLMNRAFYGLPPLTNSEGLHTNAIFGFTNMLIKLREEIEPDLIIATFDKKAPTFRHKEFSDYKAGRKKMPDELGEQFPVMKELLDHFGIIRFEMDGFEADDLIGTISKSGEAEDYEVYIVTGDRDALQLASDRTKVIITKKGVSETVSYDYKTFVEEYEVTPTQFIDVKGLMGDKSDNIPGVPGVGEKTAFKLIKEYGNIEEVLRNVENISGKKLKENIENNMELAVLSKRLATINREVPIEFSFEELQNDSKVNREGLKNLLYKLQMTSILKRIGGDEEAKAKEIEVEEVTEENSLEKALKNISGEKRIYISYITNGKSLYSEIDIKSLYLQIEEKVYYIDWEIYKPSLYNCIKNLMEDSNYNKTIHSGKNLITIFNKEKIEVKGFDFDTEIGSYIIDSSLGKYDLSLVVSHYLHEEIEADIENRAAILTSFIKPLYLHLKKKIEEENMEDLYYRVEHPLIFVLSMMESYGFNIDKNTLEELSVKFKEEIEKTGEEIYEMAEEKFNINSPKQLGKILFEKMDLPVIKKTKTGYSTNAEVLEKLSDKHPIINKITYYRQITKLNSTYIEGLRNVIDVDGKIHSSFNQAVTTTGRLSSTEPNLQNIPIKYEMGREIRKIFIPSREENLIVSFDYSQIELRVLADMAGDENMINAFKEHSDIHTKTASEVFKVSIDEVTPLMRSRAKAVNFGIVYGISDFSLAQDLKITKKEAEEYMAIYLNRYPNIDKYLKEAIKFAEDKGYVLTILNRRRYINEIKSSNKILKALGSRLAMNAPIQGSAADIIKIAMVNVFNRLNREGLKSKLILQVHDELILDVVPEEFDKIKNLVKEEMESCINLKVSLEVDMNSGKTWYEAK